MFVIFTRFVPICWRKSLGCRLQLIVTAMNLYIYYFSSFFVCLTHEIALRYFALFHCFYCNIMCGRAKNGKTRICFSQILITKEKQKMSMYFFFSRIIPLFAHIFSIPWKWIKCTKRKSTALLLSWIISFLFPIMVSLRL